MKKFFNIFRKKQPSQKKNTEISVECLFDENQRNALSQEQMEQITKALEKDSDVLGCFISLSCKKSISGAWLVENLSEGTLKHICRRWIAEKIEWRVISTFSGLKIKLLSDLMLEAVQNLEGTTLHVHNLFANYPRAYEALKEREADYNYVLNAFYRASHEEAFFAEYPFWAEQVVKGCEECGRGELIKRVYPEIAKHAEGRESVKMALEILKEGYIKNIERYLASED